MRRELIYSPEYLEFVQNSKYYDYGNTKIDT